VPAVRTASTWLTLIAGYLEVTVALWTALRLPGIDSVLLPMLAIAAFSSWRLVYQQQSRSVALHVGAAMALGMENVVMIQGAGASPLMVSVLELLATIAIVEGLAWSARGERDRGFAIRCAVAGLSLLALLNGPRLTHEWACMAPAGRAHGRW